MSAAGDRDDLALPPSKVATGKGDAGTTGLLFGGDRISKDDVRTEAYGTIDEATAALDNQTEKEVTSAIESLAGKQTIVIVAHRLTTVQNCDLVVLLSEGRVMDVGRYDELLSRNPFFRQLALAPVDRSEAP